MRIMFMGTPQFAGCSLIKLIENGYDICSVVTRADAKKDRGQMVKFSPVKEIALEHDILIYQPINLKEENFKDALEKEKPDIIVVVAYGRILPRYVLDYPKYGCINLHGSLLPKYRGSAPIQYAVAMGEKFSGVTTMFMNEGIDTGDMLLKKEVEILPTDTGGDLYDKLMTVGADLLLDTLKNIENIKSIPQNDALSTYAPLIKKEDTIIDFSHDIDAIINKIRAYQPFPMASFVINEKKYKVYKAVKHSNQDLGEYGKIVEFSKEKLLISAKNGVISILEIGPPNKKKMLISDFYNGNKLSFEK